MQVEDALHSAHPLLRQSPAICDTPMSAVTDLLGVISSESVRLTPISLGMFRILLISVCIVRGRSPYPGEYLGLVYRPFLSASSLILSLT
jgi:hypothetical protein